MERIFRIFIFDVSEISPGYVQGWPIHCDEYLGALHLRPKNSWTGPASFSFLLSGTFTHSCVPTVYSEYADLQLLLPSNVPSPPSPEPPGAPQRRSNLHWGPSLVHWMAPFHPTLPNCDEPSALLPKMLKCKHFIHWLRYCPLSSLMSGKKSFESTEFALS